MATLTSANSVLLLTVPGLYDSQIQLQGYSADDVFSTETQELNETMTGVDGTLSAGYVYAPVTLSITLQGDSPSLSVMDGWANAQKTARETMPCSLTAELPGPGMSYSFMRGFLKNYTPVSDVRKLIQPRKFTIVFQSMDGSPL